MPHCYWYRLEDLPGIECVRRHPGVRKLAAAAIARCQSTGGSVFKAGRTATDAAAAGTDHLHLADKGNKPSPVLLHNPAPPRWLLQVFWRCGSVVRQFIRISLMVSGSRWRLRRSGISHIRRRPGQTCIVAVCIRSGAARSVRRISLIRQIDRLVECGRRPRALLCTH